MLRIKQRTPAEQWLNFHIDFWLPQLASSFFLSMAAKRDEQSSNVRLHCRQTDRLQVRHVAEAARQMVTLPSELEKEDR